MKAQMKDALRTAAGVLRAVADRLDPPARTAAVRLYAHTGPSTSWWADGKPPAFMSGTWGNTG